ncbi:30S ribosomal protein S8 [Candidatus Woesearchaeota archaeon]|nr:30S ribosomal protein S8 [Candidatus Woesearchaeota archaeon]
MLNDPLANVLSVIMNAQVRNRRSCSVTPVSALVRKVLSLMNEHGYIGSVSDVKLARGDVLNVELIGAINKCGAIKPRFTVKAREFEKFEKAYLPAKDFGFIVVSTPQGVMTHVEAKERSLGGRLIAYFY